MGKVIDVPARAGRGDSCQTRGWALHCPSDQTLLNLLTRARAQGRLSSIWEQLLRANA